MKHALVILSSPTRLWINQSSSRNRIKQTPPSSHCPETTDVSILSENVNMMSQAIFQISFQTHRHTRKQKYISKKLLTDYALHLIKPAPVMRSLKWMVDEHDADAVIQSVFFFFLNVNSTHRWWWGFVTCDVKCIKVETYWETQNYTIPPGTGRSSITPMTLCQSLLFARVRVCVCVYRYITQWLTCRPKSCVASINMQYRFWGYKHVTQAWKWTHEMG